MLVYYLAYYLSGLGLRSQFRIYFLQNKNESSGVFAAFSGHFNI
jgi:hypothetical protein